MTADLNRELATRHLDWIVPAWNGPAQVEALFTTRNGGASLGAAATLDVGPAQMSAADRDGAGDGAQTGGNRRCAAGGTDARALGDGHRDADGQQRNYRQRAVGDHQSIGPRGDERARPLRIAELGALRGRFVMGCPDSRE